MSFPITGAEIAKTEAKVGFRFPLGLKSRFLKDNGGEVDVAGENWWLIPFLDSTDRKRIARTCNDITRETSKMREWSRFPEDAFVVLKTAAGTISSFVPKRMVPRNLATQFIFGIMKPENLSRWPILWINMTSPLYVPAEHCKN